MLPVKVTEAALLPCVQPPATPDSGHPRHLLANHVAWMAWGHCEAGKRAALAADVERHNKASAQLDRD